MFYKTKVSLPFSLEVFHELQTLYNREGVPTFTELIFALPGETYNSFIDGIDKLLEDQTESERGKLSNESVRQIK